MVWLVGRKMQSTHTAELANGSAGHTNPLLLCNYQLAVVDFNQQTRNFVLIGHTLSKYMHQPGSSPRTQRYLVQI